MSERTELHKLQSVLKLIYIALMISSLVYTVVGYTFAHKDLPTPDEGLTMTLLIVAFGAVFLGNMLLFTLLKPARIQRAPQPHQATFIAFIAGWVLFDVPALMGLVLTFFGEPSYQLSLFALSLLSLLSYPPTEGKLKRALSVGR